MTIEQKSTVVEKSTVDSVGTPSATAPAPVALAPATGVLAPGFFGEHWPGAPGAAPPIVLGAVAVAGIAAAASTPLDRPGVGWLVTGLAVTAGVLAVALYVRRTADRAGSPSTAASLIRLAWAGAALALLAVGAVRAAGWLFLLCLPAAAVAAALAVVGGRTVQGIATSVLVQPFAALRALPWAARGWAALRARRGGSAQVGAAVLVTIALLVVFGMLFAAADAEFARLTKAVTPSVSTLFRWVFVCVVVGGGTLGAAYLVLGPPKLDDAGAGSRRTVHRLEWTLPVAALDALFVAFVVVQLTVLFGGRQHVLRTAGLTFAEYARRGFWQLLVVTLLALAVLAAAARWAPRGTPADRVLVRVLLGALAALTLVIVASALYRMNVYEQAYGFTRLRVFVSAVELGLGVVFALVLVAGVRLRGGWLPQAVVATGVATLLGLAVLNPDRFIAEQNVARYVDQEIGLIDVPYLSGLSADAVPGFDRLPDELRACALLRIRDDLADRPDDWRGWNLGRTSARDALAARPASPPCR